MLARIFIGLILFAYVSTQNTTTLVVRDSTSPPEVFTLGAVVPISVFAAGQIISPALPGLSFAVNYAVNRINANPQILPYTRLEIEIRDSFSQEAPTLAGVADLAEKEVDAIVGPVFGVETEIAATAASSSVYNKLIVSQNGGDSLNDKSTFDTLIRILPPTENQARVIYDFLYYLASESDKVNIGDQFAAYLRVAVCGISTPYGISLAAAIQNEFSLRAREYNDTSQNWPSILTYQSVISTNQNPVLALDIDNQLQEIEKSGARVIIYIGVGADLQSVINHPRFANISGPRYLWIVSDQVAQASAYLNLTNLAEGFPIVPEMKEKVEGFVAVVPRQPTGPLFQQYLAAYRQFFSFIPGFGLDYYSPTLVDTVETVARALDLLIKTSDVQVDWSDPQLLLEAAAQLNFTGVTGPISLDSQLDRQPLFDLVNVYPTSLRPQPPEKVEVDGNNYWLKVGTWSPATGISIPFQYPDFNGTAVESLPLRFFNGSTLPPNLDVRPPIKYWSCHDSKEYVDETGLIVQVETPNYDNPDDIDATYICDQFIDCNNMSDEAYHCTPSLVILFVVMGVITGLMIVFNLIILLPLVLIFGCLLERRRIRVASPFFLIIILLSATLGLIGTYAWYGKPHTAACIFRVWLLVPSLISMIAALFAKTFRIWRIFRRSTSLSRISDWELLLLWFLQLAPVVLLVIGWTAFSTPMAGMKSVDGTDHYVCHTGGLTGEPGGLIWFSLIVAYGGILLLAGVVLIYLIRKVPTEFNESKILAVSIYNIVFLSVVTIPVYFVLENVSPFAAWLLLDLTVIYAFMATIGIQFIPMIASLVLNRCRDPTYKSGLGDSSSGSVSGSASGTHTLAPQTNSSDYTTRIGSGMATLAPNY